MPLRGTLQLTAAQRQALIHRRDHDLRPHVCERCAALVRIADGQSPHAVARHGLLKPHDPDPNLQLAELVRTLWPLERDQLSARWRASEVPSLISNLSFQKTGSYS
jgi:hypothetical protein